MLSRETILGYVDDNFSSVDVPEMGGEVRIATLSVEEMDRLGKLDDSKPASVEVVILGACGEDGKRLFKDADRTALGKLPAALISKISKAILDHNKIGPGHVEAAKNASSETAN